VNYEHLRVCRFAAPVVGALFVSLAARADGSQARAQRSLALAAPESAMHAK